MVVLGLTNMSDITGLVNSLPDFSFAYLSAFASISAFFMTKSFDLDYIFVSILDAFLIDSVCYTSL